MNNRRVLNVIFALSLSSLGLLLVPIVFAQSLTKTPTDDLVEQQVIHATDETFTQQTIIHSQSALKQTEPDILSDNAPQQAPAYIGLNIPLLATTGTLTISQEVEDSAVAGVPFTYTLTITNTSPSTDAAQVVVSAAVPDEANYLSGGTYITSSDVVSWTIPSIAAGAAESVQYTVTSCTSPVTAAAYQVITSAQGLVTDAGVPLITELASPTIDPVIDLSSAVITIGDTTYFTGTSATNGGPVSQLLWDFGDAATSDEAETSHAYTTAGTYTVTLNATDDCGFVGTTQTTVSVEEPETDETTSTDPVTDTVSIPGQVDNSDPLTDTAPLTPTETLPEDTPALDSGSVNLALMVGAPVLTITKNATNTAAVDDLVLYDFRVSHDTTSDGTVVSNVVVSDSVLGVVDCADDNSNDLLESGEEWICTTLYRITLTDTDPLVNFATVTGEFTPAGVITAQSTIHSLDIVYNPALQVVKDGPAVAGLNENVVYTFTVSHDTDEGDGSVVSNTTVIDSRVTGISLESGDDGNDGLLESDETWIFVGNYTIPTDPNLPDPLTNTATVSATNKDGGTVTANSNIHSVNIDFVPVVTLTKSGPAFATVGQIVTYTFTVALDAGGDGSPITDVAVSDVPAGAATYQTGDDGDLWLETGEVWTYTVGYQIPPEVVTPFVNTGTVTGLDRDGQSVPVAQVTYSTAITYAPTITLTKTGPASASVGETVGFTFTVAHGSGSDLSPINNVVISDPLVSNITRIAGDNGNNRLEGGEVWTYTGQYTIPPSVIEPFINTASVSGTNGNGLTVPSAQANHSMTISYAPQLKITLNGPVAPVSVGQDITYFVEVEHSSGSDDSPVTNVVVTDSLGTSYTLNPANDGDGDTLLEKGEEWIYTGVYKVPPTANDPLINTAYARGQDLDPDPVALVTASHSVPVDFDSDLVISKTGPSLINVGEVAIYTFTVKLSPTSDGSPITNVAVVDDVAGPAVLISGDDGDSKLEMNESWIFRATYTVPPTVTNPFSNTGTVTGEDMSGTPVGGGSATFFTFVNYNPVLEISKSGPTNADVGETIQYTFTVSHSIESDNSLVTDVAVFDDVAGLATLTGGDTIVANNQLDPGETWTFAVSYTVQPDDLEPLMNTATISGTDLDGDDIPANHDSHSLNIEYAPAAAILTSGPATGNVGASVQFTYAVSVSQSSGDGSPLMNVSVVDNRAGNAAYVSGDLNTNNRIDNNEIWIFRATYIVKASDPSTIVHIGEVIAEDLDGDEVLPHATDDHSFSKGVSPALTITKIGPAEADAGAPINYEITVRNNGPATAFNLLITDKIPAGASYVSGGTLVGDTVRWTVPSLAPSASTKVTLVLESLSNIVNNNYGVTSDGGVSASGTVGVTTAIFYRNYLPAVLRNDLTKLSIFNDGTGGTVFVTVVNPSTNQPVASCTVPNNLTLECGTFPSGTYNLHVNSPCGIGVFPKTYAGGAQLTRIACN